MKLGVALALIGAVSAFNLKDAIPNAAIQLTGQALSDYVNHVQSLFRAEVPTQSYRNSLMAIKHVRHPDDAIVKAQTPLLAALPTEFDSRAQWPLCAKSIGAIRDQSDCGACWAFAAAEAMSDRVCIASKGAKTPTLSADDVLSCCGLSCGIGCSGTVSSRLSIATSQLVRQSDLSIAKLSF